ncbi:MAG: glycosyltransferase [Candidatus Paceibacterota bacterium]|jgi:hypothetical protein
MDLYNNPDIPDKEAWMEHRVKLFEEYCLPAMYRQTNKNFIWLLSFSNLTPWKYIKRYIDIPFIQVICQYPRDYIYRLYSQGEIKNGDWLITSRLDNDDYYEDEFIENIQSKFSSQFLLIDTDGRQLEVSTGKYYDTARWSPNSPFISLIEQVGTPWESPEKPFYDSPVRTVYYCSHSNMLLHFPAVRIDEPLYVMVIHDRNCSNRIVGKEIIK